MYDRRKALNTRRRPRGRCCFVFCCKVKQYYLTAKTFAYFFLKKSKKKFLHIIIYISAASFRRPWGRSCRIIGGRSDIFQDAGRLSWVAARRRAARSFVDHRRAVWFLHAGRLSWVATLQDGGRVVLGSSAGGGLGRWRGTHGGRHICSARRRGRAKPAPIAWRLLSRVKRAVYLRTLA